MNLHILLLAILTFTGCVDPFDPPVENYEELLVVEAFISDDPGPQVVYLSLTSPIDTVRFLPVTGAEVLIKDQDGNQYSFNAAESGAYYSDPGVFIPLPGNIYVLEVRLSDGRRIVSEPVEMKLTPPLTEVFYEQQAFVGAESGTIEEGFVVMANTDGLANEDIYLRYDWEETYMTVPPYPAFFVYNEQTEIIEPREDNISQCWIDQRSSAINIVTTEGRAITDIREHPIRYLSFRGVELNERYSIRVKQYAMDAEAYRFWKSLKETNESTGSLFDTQPFPLTGNLMNADDQNEPVLGYFDVASVSSERIFIDKTDLPGSTSAPSLYRGCTSSSVDTLVSASAVPAFVNSGFYISYYIFPTGYVMVKPECVDCTLFGSNVKPDFWE
nr:DUF4249 domain-containing protein [Fulvivirga sedimenti]